MSGFAFPCDDCGCDPPCVTKADDFEREDADGPGPKWEEDTTDTWPVVDGNCEPTSNEIMSLLEPAPISGDTYGYKWSAVFNFGFDSTSGVAEIHVGQSSLNSGAYTLRLTATSATTATMQLLVSGSPLKDALDVPVFGTGLDNLMELCVDVSPDGSYLTGRVTSAGDPVVSVYTTGGGDIGGPYVGLATGSIEEGGSFHPYFDDAVLAPIGGPDDCPDCGGELEDCTVCENADASNADKAPRNLKFLFSGLLDKSIDTTQWNAGGEGSEVAGAGDGDDRTYDFPALNGTAIIPFASCVDPLTVSGDGISCAGGTEGDSAVIYGSLGTTLKYVQVGLLFVQGERPMNSGGDGFKKRGSSWESGSRNATRDISLRAIVGLAKRNGGGFKIYARVEVRTALLLEHNISDAWGTVAWAIQTPSAGTLAAAVFEGDWDGDCLDWSGGDITLSLVEECSGGEVDWGSVVVKVGRP